MSAPVHIRNETNELRLLFEVCQALEATGDLGSQMESILEFMASHTAMLWGGITLSAKDGIAQKGAAWRDGSWLSKLPPGFAEEHPVAAHREAMAGMIMATGLPVAVQYEAANPTALHRGNLRTLSKEDVALFSVPLTHGDAVLGALFADRLFADSVAAEEDVRLLHVIASLVSQALAVRLEFEQRHSAVVEENRRLQALLHDQFHPVGMVGNSAALQAVIRELTQVADSNATVLIRGESGTGKELAASAIHANSSRAGKPFVRLNCAALPEGLVESELFGHERGAFTGATGLRKGRFEMAHGGTLFLDEVGDLTPLTQAKLLRVLQEKEFERVGGGAAIRVDVRLIAATNRDLEQMVAEGAFRQDLYYRLSVFPILLPPLRKRREDIMPLATHFAEKYGQENSRVVRRISPEATALLTAYPWPGNIRELENVMERAVLLCGPSGVIEASHLPPALQGLETAPSAPFMTGGDEDRAGTLDAAMEALELRMITDALEDCKGNMVKAAARLGITERIMGLRMKKYGLSFKKFRNRE
ncbi:Nitrogen fixation protein VnfA [uncultured delta proteobacterium]|uniref:Nitrogen fixation protein VnfA n=1 Tax=uncultured delta proteobacterium TaxID=34034 RepID=A0A212JVW0_9DELT|nr:Nitrogen fixation protein VnfA [uncultured delta proteobacterium]